MKNSIDVSIIIVSYNTKDLLRSCVESVIKNITHLKYEIIIVDNNSGDGSKLYINNIAKKYK
ncbi:MAG: glycosyltransferase, partial [Microgenomates group bacterium GW2011_GWF1_38_5]